MVPTQDNSNSPAIPPEGAKAPAPSTEAGKLEQRVQALEERLRALKEEADAAARAKGTSGAHEAQQAGGRVAHQLAASNNNARRAMVERLTRWQERKRKEHERRFGGAPMLHGVEMSGEERRAPASLDGGGTTPPEGGAASAASATEAGHDHASAVPQSPSDGVSQKEKGGTPSEEGGMSAPSSPPSTAGKEVSAASEQPQASPEASQRAAVPQGAAQVEGDTPHAASSTPLDGEKGGRAQSPPVMQEGKRRAGNMSAAAIPPGEVFGVATLASGKEVPPELRDVQHYLEVWRDHLADRRNRWAHERDRRREAREQLDRARHELTDALAVTLKGQGIMSLTRLSKAHIEQLAQEHPFIKQQWEAYEQARDAFYARVVRWQRQNLLERSAAKGLPDLARLTTEERNLLQAIVNEPPTRGRDAHLQRFFDRVALRQLIEASGGVDLVRRVAHEAMAQQRTQAEGRTDVERAVSRFISTVFARAAHDGAHEALAVAEQRAAAVEQGGALRSRIRRLWAAVRGIGTSTAGEAALHRAPKRSTLLGMRVGLGAMVGALVAGPLGAVRAAAGAVAGAAGAAIGGSVGAAVGRRRGARRVARERAAAHHHTAEAAEQQVAAFSEARARQEVARVANAVRALFATMEQAKQREATARFVGSLIGGVLAGGGVRAALTEAVIPQEGGTLPPLVEASGSGEGGVAGDAAVGGEAPSSGATMSQAREVVVRPHDIPDGAETPHALTAPADDQTIPSAARLESDTTSASVVSELPSLSQNAGTAGASAGAEHLSSGEEGSAALLGGEVPSHISSQAEAFHSASQRATEVLRLMDEGKLPPGEGLRQVRAAISRMDESLKNMREAIEKTMHGMQENLRPAGLRDHEVLSGAAARSAEGISGPDDPLQPVSSSEDAVSSTTSNPLHQSPTSHLVPATDETGAGAPASPSSPETPPAPAAPQIEELALATSWSEVPELVRQQVLERLSHLPSYRVHPADTLWDVLDHALKDAGISSATLRENMVGDVVARLERLKPDTLYEVGISSGNPHVIYPGDHIEVARILQLGLEPDLPRGVVDLREMAPEPRPSIPEPPHPRPSLESEPQLLTGRQSSGDPQEVAYAPAGDEMAAASPATRGVPLQRGGMQVPEGAVPPSSPTSWATHLLEQTLKQRGGVVAITGNKAMTLAELLHQQGVPPQVAEELETRVRQLPPRHLIAAGVNPSQNLLLPGARVDLRSLLQEVVRGGADNTRR